MFLFLGSFLLLLLAPAVYSCCAMLYHAVLLLFSCCLPYLYTGNGHNSPAADVVYLHRVQTFLQPFVRVSVASAGMHPPAWRGRGAVAFRARRVSVKPEGGGADYPQSAGRFRLR